MTAIGVCTVNEWIDILLIGLIGYVVKFFSLRLDSSPFYGITIWLICQVWIVKFVTSIFCRRHVGKEGYGGRHRGLGWLREGRKGGRVGKVEETKGGRTGKVEKTQIYDHVEEKKWGGNYVDEEKKRGEKSCRGRIGKGERKVTTRKKVRRGKLRVENEYSLKRRVQLLS